MTFKDTNAHLSFTRHEPGGREHRKPTAPKKASQAKRKQERRASQEAQRKREGRREHAAGRRVHNLKKEGERITRRKRGRIYQEQR